ncbi:MAG: hypothetical protein LBK06_00515 [Planctomycetaceae bacterium]|jgi:hypothetical protein|nr:hypothetical protein [Planctomycetaceae bacterium]
MKTLLTYVVIALEEYVIPLLFTHVFLIVLASFVIESHITYWKDSYCRVVVVNAIGVTFIASFISAMTQQGLTSAFVRKYISKNNDGFVRSFCLDDDSAAILFVFICYPIVCVAISQGVRTYWALSLFFLFWEIILVIAAFVRILKDKSKTKN